MPIKINVKDLISFSEIKRSVDEYYEIDSFEYAKEKIRLSSPVHLIFQLLRARNGILLKGKLCTEFILECSLCLKEYKQEICTDLDEFFVTLDQLSETEEDEVFIIQDDETIDIEPMIFQNLVLSVPMKPLCSDDCKGICPKCGADLNEASCECAKEDFDERFNVLKKLKDSV